MLKLILLVFMISAEIIFVSAENGNESQKQTVNPNLMPSADDLRYFVNAVENAVACVESNRSKTVVKYPDMMFGFFIASVNFNSIKSNSQMFQRVPVDVNEQVLKILERLDKLLDHFTASSSEILSQKEKTIKHLYQNKTIWTSNLPSYNLLYRTLPVSEDSPIQLAEMYTDYKIYLNDVDEVDKWEPTPEMSDECLVALSSYEYMMHTQNVKLCELPVSCENLLKTGTDFGYALAHRILLLSMARLGVGCSVFGTRQDEELEVDLCQQAYDECRYLARNGFEVIDLMVEFMAVCSMMGHTEFLRRDWVEESIRHQNIEGCFNNPISATETNDADTDSPEACDWHTTGVAVAAISSAVRWILENEFVVDSALFNDSKMPKMPFLRRLYLLNSHDHNEKYLSRHFAL